MMKPLAALLLAALPLAQARAQVPAPGTPPCHSCTFSDLLDHSISIDQRLTANPDSCCEPRLLGLLVPPATAQASPSAPAADDEGDSSFLVSKAVGWSAWSTRLGLLSWYLLDEAHRGSANTRPLATRLPSADGRLLYLVGNGAVAWPLLVEFQGIRFRYIELGRDARAGLRHEYFRHPNADLLVLTLTDGAVSKIYNTETTWLSIFDLRRNVWLLDTVVASWEEGPDSWSLARRYQVRDAGRTLVLGPYRDNRQRYKYATLLRTGHLPESRRDLPPGTYHLLAGRYQPARAGTTRPAPAAPGTTHRPAVGAAEVNGTYADAQGRRMAVLARGGGRMQLGFSAPGRYLGVYYSHEVKGEASITADTATFTTQQAEPCALQLHFATPGTLRVRERGPGCLAEFVGTYQKISAEKPDIR